MTFITRNWWWLVPLVVLFPGVLGVVRNGISWVTKLIGGVPGIPFRFAQVKLPDLAERVATTMRRLRSEVAEADDDDDDAQAAAVPPPSVLVVPLVLWLPLGLLVLVEYIFGRDRLLPFFGVGETVAYTQSGGLVAMIALGLIVAVAVWAWEAEAAHGGSRPTWPKPLVYGGLGLAVLDVILLAWWGVVQKSGTEPSGWLTGSFEIVFLLVLTGAIAVLLRQVKKMVLTVGYLVLMTIGVVLAGVQGLSDLVLGLLNGLRRIVLGVVEVVCGPSKAVWNWLRATPAMAERDWLPPEIVWPPAGRVEEQIDEWFAFADADADAEGGTGDPAGGAPEPVDLHLGQVA